MSILHYIIGLPPVRKGGSVQYAYDLICEQSKITDVKVLICGDTLLRGRISRIIKKGTISGVEKFELTNPLTPTLIYGTSDPISQHRSIKFDKDNVKQFIVENNVTIMHLHTLMGLHKDIVEYVKSLGVKIIYTSHDFHGLCLHYNFINPQKKLCHEVSAKKCAVCNMDEPSDLFLRMANSSLYHYLKSIGLFNIIRKPQVQSNIIKKKEVQSNTKPSNEIIKEYADLIDYYKDYFRLIDKFHFNSSQTKDIFQVLLPFAEGKVIPVITRGIKDNRTSITLQDNVVFGFIGSLSDYKGFPLLKKILIELYREGYDNFKLVAYSGNLVDTDMDCPLIEYKKSYDYFRISDVLYDMDCLIVPSKWYETFSLVALEALAHGRPVIVSNHVGAKDIVVKYSDRMIFSSKQELKDILKRILDNPEILLEESMKIKDGLWPFSLENHSKEIISFYNE